ncbi:MAG: type I-E CRISPR-associated protein Cas6/Cse3/CasE [Thermoplasmata archaeon]|nr:type I-E CRISPR-associated protein Cas6/Cse3/CasE [Thermoplasmata archaeon]
MTHYFSKLELTHNGMESRMKSLSTDSYNVHKEMWDLFPGMPDSDRDFIYAILDDGRTAYMVSSREPVENNYWRIESKIYDPVVKNGDVYKFRLLANPTVAKSSDGKHKRHDVVMDMKRRYRAEGRELSMNDVVHKSVSEWMIHKGELNGFDFDESTLMTHSYTRCESKKGDVKITFSTVVIEGTLMVTDAGLFKDCLYKGIGTAKGFGCGLLLIKRS